MSKPSWSNKSLGSSEEMKEAVYHSIRSNEIFSSKEFNERIHNQFHASKERPSNELKDAVYKHDQILQVRTGFLTNELETFRQTPVSKSFGAFETRHAAAVDVFSFYIGDQTCVYNFRNHKFSSKRRKAQKEQEFINYQLTSQSRDETQQYHMRKSKKCTNLVLYKNLMDEPKLNKPLSKCMLLGKYHLKVSQDSFSSNAIVKVEKTIKDSEVQAVVADKQPTNEELTSLSDYDKITEKLLITIFGKNRNTKNDDEFVVSFVKQAVKEIYDVKLTQAVHPIKQLFKCLLQYWLLNTSVPSYRDAMQHTQSISIPSMKHFTRDANLSGIIFNRTTQATQFHGVSDTSNEPKIKDSSCDYYDKDRQIQEMERLMKNTVYTCEIPRVEQINQNRAMLSGDMIHGIESLTHDTSASFSTHSSSELSKLEEMLRKLMQDYTVPPPAAKEFLNAYLDMLLTEGYDYSGASDINTREISRVINSFESEKVDRCCLTNASTMTSQEVVIKKSKSTQNIANINLDLKVGPSVVQFVDCDEQYVPLDVGFDLIDKIAAVLTKIHKAPANEKINTKNSLFQLDPIEYKYDLEPIAEKESRSSKSEDVFTLDLCQYNLHDISVEKDSTSKGFVAITITLRERALDKEIKKSLTNSDSEIVRGPHPSVTDVWMSKLSILQSTNKCSKVEVTNFDSLASTCENKENCEFQLIPSENSLDSSFQSSNYFNPNQCNHDNTDLNPIDSEDLKQCYVLSALKQQCIENSKKVKRAEPTGYVNKEDIALEELVDIAKSNVKLIDEKLILLLLENLKLLSKNVPSMQNDIDYLCGKIKVKYEENLEEDIIKKRLKLIGDTYKDDNDNVESSISNHPKQKSNDIQLKHVEVATEEAYLKNVTNTNDKNLMVFAATEDKATYVEAEVKYVYVETSDELINAKEQEEDTSLVESRYIYRSKLNLIDTTATATSITMRKEISEKAVSIQNWDDGKTKKNRTSNIETVPKFNVATNLRTSDKRIRQISASSTKPVCNNKLPKRTIQSKPTTLATKNVKKGIKTPNTNKVRDTLTKDASKYGWSKIADTNLVKERKKMSLRHNAIYEVLLNRRATQSMSRSGSQLQIKVSSDDLKTIYRCRSESFCSG